MAVCRFLGHTPSKYIFLLLLQTAFLISAATYRTYYFDEICNDDSVREIKLDASGSGSSAIFKISRNPGYKNDIDCEIIVKPPYASSGDDKISSEEKSRFQNPAAGSNSYGIVLSVEEINLRKEEFLPGCKDILRVSLKKYKNWTTQIVGCWSNLTSQSVASLTDGYSAELKVEFKSGMYWPLASSENNLDLTVTSYALKFSQDCPQALPDNTRPEWFGCVKKDWCIWQGLTCDHRNNCGDASDEWKDGPAHCVSDTNGNEGIIGLSVGLGLVAFIAVFVIICCIRKRKKRDHFDNPTPTAPLLVADAENNQRNESYSYGSAHGDSQPPPYDYQTPYPPPPPYKE